MTVVASHPGLPLTEPFPSRDELKRPASPHDAYKVPSPQKRVHLSTAAPGRQASHATRESERKSASAAANSGGNAGPATAANCRLLWRGKVVTEHGLSLYGIAVIAHLFSVAASNSPFSPALAASASLSPFDDPFSSASSATASGADMCLGLEMLRGAPITVKGDVRIIDQNASAPELPSSSTARKGKGKADDPSVESIAVEAPTDVRVYVDDRCPETVEWFQDKFCREGRQGYGVRLNAGGEDIVIFASYPDLGAAFSASPTASTSTSTASEPSLAPLTLLLGRPVLPKTNQPRPDDPMPRENLFAKKLRKTASLPASAFPTADGTGGALEPVPKRRRQSAKDKAIASLLGGSKGDSTMPPPPARPKMRSTSSQPPSIAFPPPLSATASSGTSGRGLSRSMSSNRLALKAQAPSSRSQARQSSLPPSAGLPLRRSSSVSATSSMSASTRTFRRSLSRSSMLLESPPGSDDELEEHPRSGGGDGDLVDAAFGGGTAVSSRSVPVSMFGRAGSRAPGSPTPSLASLAGPDDDFGESLDAVAELRAFGREPTPAGSTLSRSTIGRSGKGIARSSSLPAGQFSFGAAASRAEEGTRRGSREASVVSVGSNDQAAVRSSRGSSIAASDMSGDAANAETRNKNTVKKLTAQRMEAVGCGRDHPDFKDIFSFTTRGVAFAMRPIFKSRILSSAERSEAAELIDQHLRMYLPADSTHLLTTKLLTAQDTVETPALTPKLPKLTGPPSPKSLGDIADQASPEAQTTVVEVNGTKSTSDGDGEGEGDTAMTWESTTPEPSKGLRGDVAVGELAPADMGRPVGAKDLADVVRDAEGEGEDEVLLVALPVQSTALST